MTTAAVYVRPVKEKLPPRRVRCAVVSATREERQVILDVFGFIDEHQEVSGEAELTYQCGLVSSRAVALVCAFDQGEGSMAQTIGKVVKILHPDVLLLVGHGFGITRDALVINSGDVIVPRLVHTGTIRTGRLNNAFPHRGPLNERGILPPDEDLWKTVQAFGTYGVWENIRLVCDVEGVSADVLQRDPQDSTLKELVRQFPSFVMGDMESGAPGGELLKRTSHATRYLVIKGISDVHPFPGEGLHTAPTVETVDDMRASRRTEATKNAARVARELIRRLPLRMHSPTSIERCVPQRGEMIVNRDCSGVVHKVSPSDYSSIAHFNLQHARAESRRRGDATAIFTVCAFQPSELFELVRRGFAEHSPASDPRLDDLLRFAYTRYPHFLVFSELARRSPSAIGRVLLLPTYERPRAGPEWDFFLRLNGHVPLWGYVRGNAHDIFLESDYCVIGKSLILDYHGSSRTLIVTDATTEPTRSHLLGLRDQFVAQKAQPSVTFLPLANMPSRQRPERRQHPEPSPMPT